jgi:hypothetical protein
MSLVITLATVLNKDIDVDKDESFEFCRSYFG